MQEGYLCLLDGETGDGSDLTQDMWENRNTQRDKSPRGYRWPWRDGGFHRPSLGS